MTNTNITEIRKSLQTADSAYQTFISECTQRPEAIGAHLEHIYSITDNFSALAAALTPETPLDRAHVKTSLGKMLEKQRTIYLAEAARLIDELKDTPHLTTGDKMAHSLAATDGMLLSSLIESPTSTVVSHVEDFRHLATSLNVPMKNDGSDFKTSLAQLQDEAAQQERKYHVPEGAMQAFLELDRTRFFNSVASGGQLAENHQGITELLNKQTLTKRLTQLIDRDTEHAFHTSVAVALSRHSVMGNGATIQ